MPRKKSAQWVEYEKEEIEAICQKLAKEGNEPAKIGLVLRDRYGVPSAAKYGVSVSKIAEEHAKKPVPYDMFNLMKQAIELRDHLAKHKKDAKARHSVSTIESKIRRLGKYYVRSKKMPAGWKYNADEAKLLVKGVGT